MKIRESVENDRKSIRKVHKNAFDQSEGEIVAQLAIDLLIKVKGVVKGVTH